MYVSLKNLSIMCGLAFVSLVSTCFRYPAIAEDPTVFTVADENGDGKYTGEDIIVAFNKCEQLGGCTMNFAPVIFEDVSIVDGVDESNWFCLLDTTNQTTCDIYDTPGGMILNGVAGRTVFRSPLFKEGYTTAMPILMFVHKVKGPIIKNIVFDGRKNEQFKPNGPWNAQFHYGISHWNMFYPEWYVEEHWSDGGIVENNTFINLMQHGISFAFIKNWVIKYNTVKNIGCKKGLTDCSKVPPNDWAAGYGIGIHGRSKNNTVSYNYVEKVTKYAINVKSEATGANATVVNTNLTNNIIRSTGHIGIFISGLADSIVGNNSINSTNNFPEPREQAVYFNSFGISIMANNSNLVFKNNKVLNSAGMSLFFFEGASNSNITFDGNIFSGACREKNPDYCVDPDNPLVWMRGCYLYPDIEFRDVKSNIIWRNNTVNKSNCSSPMMVRSIAGGSFTMQGNNAIQSLRP